jgi:hypothetical protein
MNFDGAWITGSYDGTQPNVQGTFEAWIYAAASEVTSGDRGTIILLTGNCGQYMSWNKSNQYLSTYWYCSNDNGYHETNGPSARKTWHHWCTVWDGRANRLYQYVNGTFVGIAATTNGGASGSNLSIGREGSSRQFSGSIAEVRIYNRSLTPSEVLQNYYAGLQRFIFTDGLVLWLDGQNTNTRVITPTTAIDMSDYDNNGSLINGVTLSRDGSTSFLFDGVNDYVDCGNNKNVQSLTQLTMSVWVKFSGLDYVGGTGALLGFMSKGNPDTSSPNTGFWFAYDNRSNGSSFTYTCFGNSAGGFAGGGNNFSSKSYTFTNNVWYNITVTVRASSSSGVLYINGVQQGSSVTFSNLSIPNTSNQLYVGRIDGTSGYFFNGNIAQVRIYNTSLSAAQVLTIYTAGRSRYGL